MTLLKIRSEVESATIVPEEVTIHKLQLDTMYDVVKDVGRLWKVATDEERCELSGLLFHRIYLKSGKIHEIMPSPVLSALLFSIHKRRGRDSNPR